MPLVRRKTWLLALGAVATVVCAGVAAWLLGHGSATDSAGPAADAEWFADITDAAGLTFVHDAGPVDGNYFMPQSMGSGAALFDYDGDGRLDLYLLTNGGPHSSSTNRLYRNRPDGTFQDVTAGSGLGLAGHFMGVAVGDVNNDGRPDVLLTEYGGIKLLLNRGDGTFHDVTAAAGLANPGWGVSAALFDYDRDGWLDLVVVNYVDYDASWPCQDPNGRRDYCMPQAFPGTVTRLFHNRGLTASDKRLHFHETTLPSGLGRLPGPGLGVVCADFDGDGWSDILVANDQQPNRLWINQHDGTFKDEAASRGVAYSGLGLAQAGMGVALGDVDGDGLMDLVVTHLRRETHGLWKQGPRGLFLDHTGSAGLARPGWQGTGFGAVLGDFDNDGHLDLAVVNGDVSRGPQRTPADGGPHWDWYADRSQLFRNDGHGRFADISPRNSVFCNRYQVGRGLAWGDVDGDGKLDLLVTCIAGRARLYRNVAPAAGHWLRVCTRLPSPLDPGNTQRDRDAIGAEVTLEVATRRPVRLLSAGDSYLCNSDATLHFGLGAHGHVDAIVVRWPDGRRERFAGTSADQLVEVRQGQGRLIE